MEQLVLSSLLSSLIFLLLHNEPAYCDLSRLHRRKLYPFKVSQGCIRVFYPEEDHGKNLQLSHHASWGSLFQGCCCASTHTYSMQKT